MVRSLMVAVLVASTAAVSAQGRSSRSSRDFGLSADAWCAQADRWNRNDRFECDVREQSLGNVSSLDVDTGGNGGIRVRGVSGSGTRVRYRIVAHARSESDARRLLGDIDVETSGGRIRARGPRTSGGQGWTVDVEVEAPHDLPLTLETNNGGISIEDVSGRTRFSTTNGGVSLTDVAGDVRGSTVNGGVSVDLEGRRWDGTGLEVQTTNGGVRMLLPDGYNAELLAETTNGGMSIDFPITIQGRISNLNRRIATTIGSGGPRIHVRTVNGGVTIARR
jgi:DUF4097 and DUF4098 domain-containing protein YvlB